MIYIRWFCTYENSKLISATILINLTYWPDFYIPFEIYKDVDIRIQNGLIKYHSTYPSAVVVGKVNIRKTKFRINAVVYLLAADAVNAT